MSEAMNENVIEYLRGQKTATATFCSQSKLGNKVKRLAEERPEECQVMAENPDGSIVAHFPVKWIKISVPRQFSEEQKAEMAERGRKALEVLRNGEKSTLDVE